MSSSIPFHLDICTLEPLVTEDTLEPMKFLPARERVLTCIYITEREEDVVVCDVIFFIDLFLDKKGLVLRPKIAHG